MYDILGFQYDNRGHASYGISSKDRIHMAIFGLVGSGKSSILKLLILQNIKRGQGVMVLDPHGELARDILGIIPQSRHDDVIYVNPSSMYKFGSTIKINPLEVESVQERYLVVMTFVNALYNLYKESWGPRLETILRNAANALVETEYNTLGNLSGMITNPEIRQRILRHVSSKNVRHFWNEIYEKQYSKDTGSSAYNKMDKILSTPAVAAMFDASKSSVTFSDIIQNRRIMVIDLGTGASDDVAAFVGTILLNMLYVEAKKRLDLQDGDTVRSNPFYVYVDEAHLFSNDTMSEMLRALRKFGVRMTIATQTANAYSKSFADEITGICQCIICGHCDARTSRLLCTSMNTDTKLLERLPNHTFAFYSAEGGKPITGIFRTRPVPAIQQDRWDWQYIAKSSVERWGCMVRQADSFPIAEINMTPLETAILSAIYGRDGLDREEIARTVSHISNGRKAVSALTDTLVQSLGYVKCDDGIYKVTRECMASYFSQAGWGRRAGGDAHLSMIFNIMKYNVRAGRYCIPDLGTHRDERADLLIYEPALTKSKKPNPDRWNDTPLAVEVETAPGKHKSQILNNYTKNARNGSSVWFVTFTDKDYTIISEVMKHNSIDDTTYKIDVADISDVPPVPFLSGRYIPLY